MKKLATLIMTMTLAISAVFGFSSCSKKDEVVDVTTKTITVGYTDYAPMNYKDDGVLVGFDTELAIMVATATDATPISSRATKMKLRITLITPFSSRKYMGRLVSPVARRIEAQKLYTISMGTAQKYSRRYVVA